MTLRTFIPTGARVFLVIGCLAAGVGIAAPAAQAAAVNYVALARPAG
jgi:hypothetical protein